MKAIGSIGSREEAKGELVLQADMEQDPIYGCLVSFACDLLQEALCHEDGAIFSTKSDDY